MVYLVDDKKYGVSYSELREKYHEFINMPDAQFLKKINEALHFACFVSWFKELSLDQTLGDSGIVHELVHLIDIPDEPLVNLQEIRDKFKTMLVL